LNRLRIKNWGLAERVRDPSVALGDDQRIDDVDLGVAIHVASRRVHTIDRVHRTMALVGTVTDAELRHDQRIDDVDDVIAVDIAARRGRVVGSVDRASFASLAQRCGTNVAGHP